MKIVLQRVSSASVTISQNVTAKISKGLVLLLGIGNEDNIEDIDWLVKKVIGMRIFNDADEQMNLSIKDIEGCIIVVSQFTLLASIKKGNRPSYMKAAKPNISSPLYEKFISILKEESQLDIQTGIFGADMRVEINNDGPVTIILDSKNRM